MHHIIYRTTNLVNQHFYVGMQSTRNLNDGYLGSGKRIKVEIRKYGKHNFEREILATAHSRDELRKLETAYVTEELLKNPLCINITLGGYGGWYYATQSRKGKPLSPEHIAKLMKSLPSQNPEAKKKMIASLTGKSKSDDHKRALSEANREKKFMIIECPHCGKNGGDRAMKRWHFDNCINKKQENIERA